MKIIAEIEVEAERIKEFIEHVFSHDPKAKLNIIPTPVAPITPDTGGGKVPPPPPGGGGGAQ